MLKELDHPFTYEVDLGPYLNFTEFLTEHTPLGFIFNCDSFNGGILVYNIFLISLNVSAFVRVRNISIMNI